jgi:hypothetical protein
LLRDAEAIRDVYLPPAGAVEMLCVGRAIACHQSGGEAHSRHAF